MGQWGELALGDAENSRILWIFGEELLRDPLQLSRKVAARRFALSKWVGHLATAQEARRRDAAKEFTPAEVDSHRPLPSSLSTAIAAAKRQDRGIRLTVNRERR